MHLGFGVLSDASVEVFDDDYGAAISIQSIQLFPSPTATFVNIQTKEKIIDLKIIDISGRTTNVSNFTNNKIDVSNLPAGIYFIAIKTDKGWFKE